MNADVMTKFLKPLMAIYGTPKQVADVESFLGIYSRILKGYSPEALERAADYILRNHRYKSWPTPAECDEACKYEADEIARAAERAKAGPSTKSDYDATTKERWRLAKEWRDKTYVEHGSVDNFLKKFRPKSMFEGRK